MLVPTIDETVEKTTLAHEDYPPNMSQQLAVHWMWQCRLLVAERDAMLRSLKETQDTLHQQQVVQMEEEVRYEDHIARLLERNCELENNLIGSTGSICKGNSSLKASSYFSSQAGRKRKRSRSMENISTRESKRRCIQPCPYSFVCTPYPRFSD